MITNCNSSTSDVDGSLLPFHAFATAAPGSVGAKALRRHELTPSLLEKNEKLQKNLKNF
jgi:hypothetical protein